MNTASAIGREFELWFCQTNDYNIGIRPFSTKHAVLLCKSKD